MIYSVKYLPIANKDILSIGRYLSKFYPSTAGNFFTTLEKRILSLPDMPYMGERYKLYRKLVVLDYLIFYRVNEEERAIEIYRILHGSRNIKHLIRE